ncbi:MAG: cytochrome c biogenesis protein CcsA [Anaerolineae bacterium]|nr:cytochrome c biogenesis protein CcsA [Anaerolineae bacterium]
MFAISYVLLWLALSAYVAHLMRGERWMGRVATGLTVAAWGALTGELVARGVAAGHWPLTNRYEFALCFAWAIVAVYLLLEASWLRPEAQPDGRERRAGAFALAVALLVMTYAVTRSSADRATGPLLPALRSVWLQVHVLTAMVGYAAFGVAAGVGAMRLVQGDGEEPRWPEPGVVERAIERAVALGFPWLTLAILSGAIWAQNAWGRYWGWDPKETWALITWLWYLLILHVSPLRRWRGRRLAVLAVIGFGVVLFTFIGVPWLVRTVRLESLHGF